MRHVGGPKNSHNSVKQVLNSVIPALNSVKQVLNSVKQVLNSVKYSVKQVLNSVKRPCKGALRLNTVKYGSWDLNPGCVLLPLGSPTTDPKQPYVHARRASARSCRGDAGGSVGGVWYQGGYTGGYTGRAIPGYYPATARGSPPDSEAGP